MSLRDDTTGPSPLGSLRIDGTDAEVLELRIPPPDEERDAVWRCPGCGDHQEDRPALYLLVRSRRRTRMEQWMRLCDRCCRNDDVRQLEAQASTEPVDEAR